MERQISILGWVLIIFTTLLIISLFVSLFTRLKGNEREPKWINAMKQAGTTLRDSFAEENRKMQELSEKVASIKNSPIDHHHNGTSEAGEKE